MTDLTIDGLVSLMRSQPMDLLGPPSEVRKAFSSTMSASRDPGADPGVESDLGGKPALRFGDMTASTPTLLYLHGGGYVFGSAHDYSGLASNLGIVSNCSVWALDYRLAPEHPYPAAIEDCLAAYEALLQTAKSASSIAVAGDSAGGGLALSLLIRARDAGLAMPGALVLLSPWLDLACTGASMDSKAADDPSLSKRGLRALADHYISGSPPAAEVPAPLKAGLSGLPPMLIQVGSSEILLDDAVQLAAVAGAADVSVRLEIWPGMIHVWQVFAPILQEGRAALAAIGEFIQSRCAPVGMPT